MHTIKHYNDGFPGYVVRPPTDKERFRFIRNGYEPPDLVRENEPSVYQYLRAELPPNYSMPAIQYEVGYLRAYPTDRVYACALFYRSNPNTPVCLELWGCDR